MRRHQAQSTRNPELAQSDAIADISASRAWASMNTLTLKTQHEVTGTIDRAHQCNGLETSYLLTPVLYGCPGQLRSRRLTFICKIDETTAFMKRWLIYHPRCPTRRYTTQASMRANASALCFPAPLDQEGLPFRRCCISENPGGSHKLAAICGAVLNRLSWDRHMASHRHDSRTVRQITLSPCVL